MGNWFCRGKKMKILLQGLVAAGKTTLLYRMKLNRLIITIPTISFNLESVAVDGAEISCWDIGTREKSRPLMRHYYPDTQGFVSVIDSSNRERLDEALDDLIGYILQEEATRETVVLVLANKQDKAGALTDQEIEDALLAKYTFSPESSHTVFVMPCSAVSGEGVHEAFSYLVQQMFLNSAGRAKRGLITIRERTAGKVAGEHAGCAESLWKSLLKNPYDHLKYFMTGRSPDENES